LLQYNKQSIGLRGERLLLPADLVAVSTPKFSSSGRFGRAVLYVDEIIRPSATLRVAAVEDLAPPCELRVMGVDETLGYDPLSGNIDTMDDSAQFCGPSSTSPKHIGSLQASASY